MPAPVWLVGTYDSDGKAGLHTMFVGQVIDTKVDEEALPEDGSPDADKVAPFAFLGGQYRALGEMVGDPFSIGKKL